MKVGVSCMAPKTEENFLNPKVIVEINWNNTYKISTQNLEHTKHLTEYKPIFYLITPKYFTSYCVFYLHFISLMVTILCNQNPRFYSLYRIFPALFVLHKAQYFSRGFRLCQELLWHWRFSFVFGIRVS